MVNFAINAGALSIQMPIYAASPSNIAHAAADIRAGELVALPTETVYGLGADATNAKAVAKIFTTKGRPHFNPLIVHVRNVDEAREFANFSNTARTLAAAFWPGPLTMVLPLKSTTRIPDLTVAGLSTVAVRVPSHPVARQLIAEAGRPIAAPSANISGHVSATTAEHVVADFGERVEIILDGGPCRHGLESTIIAATDSQPVILRHGAITQEELTAAAGKPFIDLIVATQKPSAPGQLASHYAPRCPVRLNAVTVRPGEALLAFGPEPIQHSGAFRNLSPTGDIVEAAISLFAALRALDQPNIDGIAVMTIPAEGLGAAINDRLSRAAAPR